MRIRSSVVILGIAAACQGANSGPAKPDQVGRPTERAGGVMGTMQQVKVAAVHLASKVKSRLVRVVAVLQRASLELLP